MNDLDSEKYPECTKFSGPYPRAKGIQEFLDFLKENQIRLCRLAQSELPTDSPFYSPVYEPCIETTDILLDRFLGIDRAALEVERRAMVDEIRQASG